MVYSLHITITSFDTRQIQACQNEIQQLYSTLHPTSDAHTTSDKHIQKHVVSLPTQRTHVTVLRSPHIDKKSREQFVIRRMRRCVEYAFDANRDVSMFIFGVQNLECAGVELKLSLRSWNYFYDTPTN